MYNQKYHKFNSFYNHKFAFHITGPRQDAFNEVLRLKPKVVKTLDFSVDIMKRFKEEIPDLFLIGRLFVHPQDFGQLSGGTAQVARQRGLEMAERAPQRGMPGMPSALSPTSASQSGIDAGETPNFSTTPASFRNRSSSSRDAMPRLMPMGTPRTKR